jgi:glycolate oxidase iron-sulfur subunit
MASDTRTPLTTVSPATRPGEPNQSPGLGRNLPYERFLDCVHCGLCLSACPTYVETGNENDSPRGRIYLWRAVTDGRAELTPEVRHHLDLCLECRACESACPSGVQYGKVIGSYRKDMARLDSAAPMLNVLQRWMLFHLTPYAGRMRWALAPMRLAQKLRLGGVVNTLARLLPASLRRMQEIIPPLQPGRGRLLEVLPAEGPRRARVALLVGCAADAFFPQTTLATAKVLQRNGCEVWIPPGQGCCGALHYHSGLVEAARAFARANVDAVSKELGQVDAIINNAGGCGPVLKEYDHLLGDTPQAEEEPTLTLPARMARDFASKVRDISEFLMALGPVAPTHPLSMKATYHDACGLSHAQKIRQAPRDLLGLIPELELVPLPESEYCCGAAGSYNITQPKMAAQVGERKAQHIQSTGAQAVFAGNVGCLLQISRHLRQRGSTMWVAHPVDALWASYSGERNKT